jgi:F-type H+-transporting ATPase subunit b
MANEPAQAAHPAAAAAAPTAGQLHTSTGAVEHKEVFPPFDPSTFSTQLIWLAISFLVLYVVLSRLALPRIGSILEDRKARIEGDLAAADTSRQKTDAAIAAYEAALAAARQKSQTLAEETRTALKAEITAKRTVVEADLSKRVAEAEASIQQTKIEALGHVAEIAADTVQALVTQLAGAVTRDEAREAVALVAKE